MWKERSDIVHDNLIIGYEVDLENKTVKLNTYNKKENTRVSLLAVDVLTHSFENILLDNIILAVEESSTQTFLEDNSKVLLCKKDYCWPIDYEGIDELENFLIDNEYKYIKIYSSYGLTGWILAKKHIISDHH